MSNVTIQHRQTQIVTTCVYEIAGAPDTRRQWGQRVFRPDRLTAVIKGGELTNLSISGPWLLKSGREGERLSNSYYGAGALSDAPEWLRPLVDQIIAAIGATR